MISVSFVVPAVRRPSVPLPQHERVRNACDRHIIRANEGEGGGAGEYGCADLPTNEAHADVFVGAVFGLVAKLTALYTHATRPQTHSRRASGASVSMGRHGVLLGKRGGRECRL